jgi:hypothetical protein
MTHISNACLKSKTTWKPTFTKSRFCRPVFDNGRDTSSTQTPAFLGKKANKNNAICCFYPRYEPTAAEGRYASFARQRIAIRLLRDALCDTISRKYP